MKSYIADIKWFFEKHITDALFVLLVYVLLGLFFGLFWVAWIEVACNETSVKVKVFLCAFGVGLYYATKFAFMALTQIVQGLVELLKRWGVY